MAKLISKFVAIATAIMGFLIGLSLADWKTDKLNGKLKQELGEGFNEKHIQEIYLAGPNKTHICN